MGGGGESHSIYEHLEAVWRTGVRKSSAAGPPVFLPVLRLALHGPRLLPPPSGHQLSQLARVAQVALLAGLQVADEAAEDRIVLGLLAGLFPAADQPGPGRVSCF